MKYTYNNYNNFVPVQVHNNIPDIPDFKYIPEDYTTTYDYFKLIFTSEIIETITKESKKYIEEIFMKKMVRIGKIKYIINPLMNIYI